MRYWSKLTWLLLVLSGCARNGPPQFGPSAQAGGAGTSANGGRGSNLGASRSDADGGKAAGGSSGSRASRAGAGGKAAAGGGSGAAANGGGSAASPSGNGIKASDEVFRDDVLRTYELTFADADWDQLQRTATEEQFVPAQLSVDGEAVGQIGIRYKGAYGTLQDCFMDGMQVCRKLSMKMKFSEYDPDLRFHGLKKLNLHSSLRDASHLHERVSYKLFREFGVLAPRSVHARVVINGEYVGLYNLTEEIDGRFTDLRFAGEEGQGTLYKEAWPSSSTDPGYYTHAQQTNEGSPVTKVTRFAEELASSDNYKLGELVSRWMDPVVTLRYLAVHTATKHWDGPLTFYCSEEWGCNNHNYFIYESVASDHFEIVAWDTDNTFYDNVLTDQAAVPEWWEPVAECDREATEGFLPPGCDRLIQGFVQLGLDRFRDTLSELLAGPYNVAALQADVDRWAAQIDEAVKTDPNSSGYDDWRGNVDYLKTMIDQRHTATEAIRDAL
jgi:hypothetical protein